MHFAIMSLAVAPNVANVPTDDSKFDVTVKASGYETEGSTS